MLRKILQFILFLALVSAWVGANGATQPDYYKRWAHLPSDELLQMGSSYAELKGQPDSALVCFTIVAGKYQSGLSKQEKFQCARGYIGKWYVYFFCYFDYSQAYENLSRAQELAHESGKGMGRVLLNFGCMYQTISEQSRDLKPDSLALDYYKRSFWQSIAERDTSTWNMAISNMIFVAHTLSCIDSIGGEMSKYRQMMVPRGNVNFNLLLYEGLLHLEQGRYQQALDAFDRQKKELLPGIGSIRYHYSIYSNQARVYAAMGDYGKAIKMMMRADSVASELDMKDARLETYSMLGEYYEHLNDKQQTEYYRNHYFRLKDTLLNYHQVATVGELRFLDEMKRVDKQIQEMDHQRHIQSLITRVIILIALIILASMLVVWRKNRLLRQRNETLYRKNVEMLRREEEERRHRKELEQLAASVSSVSPEKPKYTSTHLDEDARRELYDRILDVMENSDAIFSSDFSGQQLASMVDTKYNYVSQVINERYGSNFNAFVNEYRIQEACKRINDQEHFGHLTIEAVANSVGFKSRTSFVQSFKRYTGLTPSEYQRIARENSR